MHILYWKICYVSFYITISIKNIVIYINRKWTGQLSRQICNKTQRSRQVLKNEKLDYKKCNRTWYFRSFFLSLSLSGNRYNPDRNRCVTLSRVTLWELELHRWDGRARIKGGSFRSFCSLASAGSSSRSLSPTIRLNGGPVAYRKWGRRRERTQEEVEEEEGGFYPRGGPGPKSTTALLPPSPPPDGIPPISTT